MSSIMRSHVNDLFSFFFLCVFISLESYHDVADRNESLVWGGKDRLRGVKMAETVTASDEFVENCEDVWILEMKYRMAVAYLSACWNKSTAEMTKVFTALKREECGRRFRTRELLAVFLEKQDELWLSLPAISAPLIKDLQGKPRDPAEIETEVQDIIRNRAATKQKDKGAEGMAEELGPGLADADPSQGDFDLQSPILSDILVKVDLLEVKYAPYLMKQWKTVLAVATANSFLHLFDISSSTPMVAPRKRSKTWSLQLTFQPKKPSRRRTRPSTARTGTSSFSRPTHLLSPTALWPSRRMKRALIHSR